MSQADKAARFRSLHVPGAPLVLYNIWDAGGAKTVAASGARAVATGSWSVAAAHGYADGEDIPLDFVLRIVDRIVQSVDLPLTVDFEGGYAAAPADVAANVARVIAAGAVGINFEDRVVKGAGLHPIAEQVERIRAVRQAAVQSGVPLFINARTDLFLQAADGHEAMLDEALERSKAYRDAGADGFFVPGLTDEGLIAETCRQVEAPVNVMMAGPLTSPTSVARLGVARASFGPRPYRDAQKDLAARLAGIMERPDGAPSPGA